MRRPRCHGLCGGSVRRSDVIEQEIQASITEQVQTATALNQEADVVAEVLAQRRAFFIRVCRRAGRRDGRPPRRPALRSPGHKVAYGAEAMQDVVHDFANFAGAAPAAQPAWAQPDDAMEPLLESGLQLKASVAEADTLVAQLNCALEAQLRSGLASRGCVPLASGS